VTGSDTANTPVKRGVFEIRKVDVVIAAGLGLIATVTAIESVRLGAGWGASGPQPGFVPAIMSGVILVGAVLTIIQALKARDLNPLFESRAELVEALKVGVPIGAAVLSVYWLGFYLMVAAYGAAFTWWYGRFRWYLVVPVAIAAMLLLHWALEDVFRLFLPKSVLYHYEMLPM
jgi:putative tricarboxylic transport membrane protein